MNQAELPQTDRRTWLTAAVRYGVLGGLGVVTWQLVLRGDGSSCPPLTSACASCGLWSRCELPRAQQSRRHQSDKEQVEDRGRPER